MILKILHFLIQLLLGDINENGIGLFNWFMKQSGEINGYSKSIWTGVTTLTLAKAMHEASYQKITGVYNLVNNSKISKYDLLKLFNKYSNKGLTINKIDGIEQDKSLVRTRTDFSFIVPTYEDQVKDLFEWIKKHRLSIVTYKKRIF